MRLAVILSLLPCAAVALPDLTPQGGRVVASDQMAASAIPMPSEAWSDSRTPRVVEGSASRRVWQVPDTGATPLQLLSPLRDRLTSDGFAEVFTCADAACGGFDFRFGLQLIGPPEMFVDLANYHYALLQKGSEEVAIVSSRDATTGFVHVTTLGADLPVAAVQAASETPVTASPAPTVQSSNDIASTLLTTGRVALDDVAFASGAATLTDGDAESLASLVRFLADRPESRIALVGHTDAVGSLAANTALSKRRAQAIADRLVALGADAQRIEAEGAGYLAPRAPNVSAEGRALNRRVEAVLLDSE